MSRSMPDPLVYSLIAMSVLLFAVCFTLWQHGWGVDDVIRLLPYAGPALMNEWQHPR